MADESKTPAPAQGQQAQARGDFAVDMGAMSTHYANFARVTGTPEELVLDFGLNTSMQPTPGEPVRITHRLVLNYYTAKRLLMALGMAVQQHERVYGVLETDVQKRVRMTPGAPQAGGARPGTTPS